MGTGKRERGGEEERRGEGRREERRGEDRSRDKELGFAK